MRNKGTPSCIAYTACLPTVIDAACCHISWQLSQLSCSLHPSLSPSLVAVHVLACCCAGESYAGHYVPNLAREIVRVSSALFSPGTWGRGERGTGGRQHEVLAQRTALEATATISITPLPVTWATTCTVGSW